MTFSNESFQIYSDLFKDVYGFRPRVADCLGWDDARFDEEFEFLQEELVQVMANDKRMEQYALSQFHSHAAGLRHKFGINERSAFIWFFESETGETLENREAPTRWDHQKVEQFLYSQGVPYEAWPELLAVVGLKGEA